MFDIANVRVAATFVNERFVWGACRVSLISGAIMSIRSYLFAVFSAGAVLGGMGAASAQDGSSIWPTELYFRVEGGAAWLAEDRGNWAGPGGTVVTYDLDADGAFIGSAAFGAQFHDGVRGDLSLSYLSEADIDANWIAPLPGPHADIDASVSTWLIMANLFVEPLTLAGYESPIKPFVTGGIGVAVNDMDDWTRTNTTLAPPDTVREFEGKTNTSFAWSLGGGVSAEVGDLFGTGSPVEVDLTYRYTDAGEAKGGTTPTGNGQPATTAFNYDNTFHAVSIGVRIPFSTH
ncbi:hypothetical protein GR183_11870 [Stappia sp. GBMRC 2046]|uniref:Opacity protein n=1 Tax=Stappia sediminis TaxID=2692190 RepID=A0A7X3LUY8_9HYPH|nr:porin family protein [Stappia sediminis]MXN65601.1 hypothetical protein [Stappia sediminis]